MAVCLGWDSNWRIINDRSALARPQTSMSTVLLAVDVDWSSGWELWDLFGISQTGMSVSVTICQVLSFCIICGSMFCSLECFLDILEEPNYTYCWKILHLFLYPESSQIIEMDWNSSTSLVYRKSQGKPFIEQRARRINGKFPITGMELKSCVAHEHQRKSGLAQ